MDEIGRKVVAAAHGVLKRLVESGTLHDDHVTEVHMAVTALGYELNRSGYDPVKLAEVRADEAALVQALRPVMAASGAVPARTWADAWQSGVGSHLAGLIETAPASVADDVAVVQQLRDFLVGYHEPMDPVVGAGTRSTYQGGRGDKAEAAEGIVIYITAPGLQSYLRRRFPDRSTEVFSVERLMGGYSKETYIVRLDEGDGPKTIVIRKDGYGLPTGSSVANEFAVLQEVHALGMPVPEPLWLETDTAPFATAFMAVGHVSGKPANQAVLADTAEREAWADAFAHALALLHRSTAQPDADVRDVLRAEIADLRRRMRERERAPHPGLSLGLAWLETHLDDLAGRPACRVHGDFGFHNMLMAGPKLVAVLDWEFSHIGDPVEDLVMFRPFMEQIGCWDRFIGTYGAECGFSFDEGGARYFGVWTEVRNLVACLGSLNSLLMPQVTDVALSVAGTIYIPKYEIAVLDAIIGG
ncbi:phosphotransferase family protein [Flavisphingomonas formosensis]|uniref:phosphotransferase family protein n=1 Tax=Flavisphingomonas formosensis TaxID=861534 RepID=UPI0012FC5F19|nr:phosphotransferase family protein [Sphingomonas formosensis]